MTELLWWRRVGQRVVCVNGWAWYDEAMGPLSRYHAHPCIEQGGIYTISALNAYGHPFIQLAEFDRTLGWWPVNRFRPVRETSIESLRGLLSPTPDDVRRYADELKCL